VPTGAKLAEARADRLDSLPRPLHLLHTSVQPRATPFNSVPTAVRPRAKVQQLVASRYEPSPSTREPLSIELQPPPKARRCVRMAQQPWPTARQLRLFARQPRVVVRKSASGTQHPASNERQRLINFARRPSDRSQPKVISLQRDDVELQPLTGLQLTCRVALRRVSVKVEPSPSRLHTVNSPPIPRARSREIARPSPTP
jgi:hypothetical protein